MSEKRFAKWAGSLLNKIGIKSSPPQKSRTRDQEEIVIKGDFLKLRPFLYPDGLTLGDRAMHKVPEIDILTRVQEFVRCGEISKARKTLLEANGSELCKISTYWFLLAFINESLQDSISARQNLNEVLGLANLDSRSVLSCYYLLRQLGEEIPKEVAGDLLGVVVEIAHGEIITIAAGYADGTPRLLASSGKSVIGEGKGMGILPRSAAKCLVSRARSLAGKLPLEVDRNLPKRGWIRFALLTPGGVFSITETEENVMSRNDLSGVAGAAQDIIGALIPLFELSRGGKNLGLFRQQMKKREAAALAEAIRAPQSDKVRFMIEEGADLDILATEEGFDQTPPIIYPASSGSVPILKALIDAGADVNAQDKTLNSATPLMIASRFGYLSIVEILINGGADVEQRDVYGNTALMYAAGANQVACGEKLIQAGADVNAVDDEHSTPIMFSAERGFLDFVVMLLEHGGDPHFKGKHGASALDLAKQNDHQAVVKRIWNKGGPSASTSS